MTEQAQQKILLVAPAAAVVDVLSDELPERGCTLIEAPERVDKIIAKQNAEAADAIVVDVQTDQLSVKDLINQVKESSDPKPKVLLFSYFVRIDSAQYSDKHYYYTNYLKKNPDPDIEVKYLGAFNKEGLTQTLAKAICQQLA